MEQYAHNLVYTDEEKVITYCKNIVKAVEKTRDVAAQSKLKSCKIEEALQTKDKQTMWNVLQEYIHNHPELFTIANGVRLIQVDTEFYKNVSEENIVTQLEILRGLIYLNEAKHCVAKEKIKACFKKLLKQSGVFSEYEIGLL